MIVLGELIIAAQGAFLGGVQLSVADRSLNNGLADPLVDDFGEAEHRPGAERTRDCDQATALVWSG